MSFSTAKGCGKGCGKRPDRLGRKMRLKLRHISGAFHFLIFEPGKELEYETLQERLGVSVQGRKTR